MNRKLNKQKTKIDNQQARFCRGGAGANSTYSEGTGGKPVQGAEKNAQGHNTAGWGG